MNHEEKLQSVVEELLRGHGYIAERTLEKLFFPEQHIALYSKINFTDQTPERVMMQIDISIELLMYKKEIRESFVGIGKDVESALRNAVENFWRSALHVLLAAFFNDKKVDVVQEQWQIKGESWNVFLGDPLMRGRNPQIIEIAKPLLDDIQKLIESEGIEKPASWLSMFLSSSEKQIFLNNNRWVRGEELFKKYQWPEGSDYYSLRLCLAFIAQ
ncbi:hypothetical protein KBD59_04715 [Candidatus Gracilibacteria bacterium]|nr:hypothetical protein [Candidatus Gracilibacteria bacterium]